MSVSWIKISWPSHGRRFPKTWRGAGSARLSAAAGFTESEHAQILILRGENRALPDLEDRLLELEIATRGQDAGGVVQRLGVLVPTFRADAAHTPTPAPQPI